MIKLISFKNTPLTKLEILKLVSFSLLSFSLTESRERETDSGGGDRW